MVGLRWWNEVSESGGSDWKFECLEEGQREVRAALVPSPVQACPANGREAGMSCVHAQPAAPAHAILTAAAAAGWQRWQVNKKDSFMFWALLYATPAAWLVLGLVALLKLNIDYLLLVVIAVLLRWVLG